MSDFINFAQALENQIRRELESECNEGPESTWNGESDYVFLGYLLGQTPQSPRTHSYQKSPYVRFHKPPPPRPAHKMTPDQLESWTYLKSFDSQLGNNFSNQDLKRAYRMALLRTHPDQGGSNDKFWKVQEAYTALKTLPTDAFAY